MDWPTVITKLRCLLQCQASGLERHLAETDCSTHRHTRSLSAASSTGDASFPGAYGGCVAWPLILARSTRKAVLQTFSVLGCNSQLLFAVWPGRSASCCPGLSCSRWHGRRQSEQHTAGFPRQAQAARGLQSSPEHSQPLQRPCRAGAAPAGLCEHLLHPGLGCIQ